MASDFTVDRASKKYVLGSDGYLKEYANDEPAIEFNPDGSYRGVLVEPAATNRIEHSVTPSVANGWSIGGSVTVTNNLDNTLSQTFKSTRLQFSGSSESFYDTTLVDGSADVASVWIKGTAGETIKFGIGSNVGQGSIFTLTGDWQRIVHKLSDSTAASAFFISTFSNVTARDIEILLPQREYGTIATSVIPTSGSAITRLKDDIYLTSASSLIGQTEGTLFVEVDWQETNGASQCLLALSNGTADNRIQIEKNDPNSEFRMILEANNSVEVVQGESYSTYSGIQKFAMAYAQNDVELYRNGSSVSTDTSADLSSLATLNEIDFANRDFGLGARNQANMWIRAVALFTTRLSDAECQALTTI